MKDKPVIVIGAGGHAKVLIEILLLCKVEIIGVVDADISKLGMDVLGVQVLGDDSFVEKYSPENVVLVNAIGSVKSPQLRTKIYSKFTEKKYCFRTVIHPSAIVSSFAQLAEGVQIMAGAVVQHGCIIGENVIINTNAAVDHECTIGNNVHIAPGSVISGNVIIGDHTHIGTGAIVIQGVTIGENVLIGAGAVVLKKVKSDATAFGVPAREVNL